jgi:hypothetical protein
MFVVVRGNKFAINKSMSGALNGLRAKHEDAVLY